MISKLRFAGMLILLISYVAMNGCTSDAEKQHADLIISGGNIYTMDEGNPIVEAVVVNGNRIIYAGDAAGAQAYSGDNTREIRLEGRTMTPGWVEGHGHFMGMGYNKLDLDLLQVRSYQEMIDKVAEAVAEAEPGEWITGRGWHQSKWNMPEDEMIKGFPTHDRLSEVSPDNPVVLRHASGHALIANSAAMETAGVLPMSTESMQNSELEGGEIIRDEMGNPTGVFNERAMGLVNKYVPENTPERDRKAFDLAVKNCWAHGITAFHDAGVGRETIDMYQKMKEKDSLGVRLYVMVTGFQPDYVEEWFQRGPMIDSTGWLTIRSVKLNCDGALGSRGAWLLEEYTDRPGHFGHETLPMSVVADMAEKGLEYGFQICSHAIGDRANREILDRYEAAFVNNPDAANDHRYRIEHAQHLHPDDIPRFGELGVIPAMQAIHMASDRPWAIDRLGEKRIIEGAYVWQKLLQSGARIVNGTDVPVEPIDPIPSFYASVARKTLEGTPEGGYEPDQRMSREEALRSYTLDAAYGAFMENLTGSIEVGKLADFTVLDKDIMTIPESEILNTEVAMTIIDGKVVYEK
ncbi:MAG: amidohydrolase family protein [Cyclobacteriaceae bacterium]